MIRCTNIYCCTRERITQHHLIPKPFRKGISGRIGRVYLCNDCHVKVHKMKTNTELALYYNTKQSIINLLASDVKFRVQRFMNVLSNEYEYNRMVA